MELRAKVPYLDANYILHIPRPTLILLCGPSGSGKSSFAARHFPETAIISSDRCRAMISDSVRNQEINPETFGLVHYIARLRLKVGRTTVIDSTAVQDFARRPLLEIARDFGCPSLLLILDVPEEICRARDAARIDPPPVGAAVVTEQYRLFQETLRLAMQEGFSNIVRLTPAEIEWVKVRLEE
jgi:protein phosphatase